MEHRLIAQTPNVIVKSILAMVLIFTTHVMAHAATIKVTTTADQNGEDSKHCSLREAVHASLSKKPFGGCISGQKYYTDIIQLSAETYRLDTEIDIIKRVEKFGRSIRIEGADVFDYLKRDHITGQLAQRSFPSSIIESSSGKRLFNSLEDSIGLTLNNISIKNAGSTSSVKRGGAFLVGGDLDLNNVFIDNVHAQENGGAIFLEGKNSNLTANNIQISNSSAQQGAAISQFCDNNLAFDKRTIVMNNVSIINNNASAGSIIYTCGAQQLQLENVTIADNKSSQAALSLQDISEYQQGSNTETAKISLKHVTVINNTTGISYSDIGSISIKSSVIAFNDKDCRYVKNKKELDESDNVTIDNTMLSGDSLRPVGNSCDLKQVANVTDKKDANGNLITNIVADKRNTYVPASSGYNTYFEQGLKDYGLGFISYLPKTDVDAIKIDGKKDNCNTADLRGVAREQASGLFEDTNQTYSCFKGSVNRSTLFARNDLGNENKSYAGFIKDYNQRIQQKPSKDFSQKDLAVFKAVTKRLEAELQGFKDAFKDTSDKNLIRVIIVDVLSNDMPVERVTAKGSEFVKFPLQIEHSNIMDMGNYSYSVKSIGTTEVKSIVDASDYKSIVVDVNSASNLVCKWNAQTAKLIAYRKDKGITPAGKNDWCSYTVTHNDTGATSTGLVQLKFSNIAPIAKDKEIITSGFEEKITVSLVDLISDNGDGPHRDGVDHMYISEDVETPVYMNITQQPEIGSLNFDQSLLVDCPVPDKIQVGSRKCYTGDITYTRFNTLSQFGDTFKYKVYDCGSRKSMVTINVYDKNDPSKIIEVKKVPRCDTKTALASNEAKITIKTVRNTKKTSVFKGGGSFGSIFIWLLVALGLLSVRFSRLEY